MPRQRQRMQFKGQAEAEAWLRAHGVKVTAERFAGRQAVEAFAPVGLRVLAAVEYIRGVLVYQHKEHRVGDWQVPPRRAFLKPEARTAA